MENELIESGEEMKAEINWDQVMLSAKKAVNIITSMNSNTAVKIYIEGKDYQEIVNDVIICSLSESPASSRRMFEFGSKETLKNMYIRMVHDFTKKCNKKKNDRIYQNPFRRTNDLIKFFLEQYENDPNSNFVKRTWLFKGTLSGRDLDIFNDLLDHSEINKQKLAKKYSTEEESVTRAKNRLMRRYKDYLGLIRYYETSYLEDITEGQIRRDLRDE